MAKKKTPEVEESSKYDNFVGQRNTEAESTLSDFLKDQDINADSKLEEWERHWNQMPSFKNDKKAPFKTLYIHFRNVKDYEEFCVMINQKLTLKSKSTWHPIASKGETPLMRWVDGDYDAEE